MRGAARPARLRVTVRAQLRAVPAGGAWPDLHSTLRPCDVSRGFVYKAGERRNSCSSFRPSFCVVVSRALRALPPNHEYWRVPVPDGGGCLPAAQLLHLLLLLLIGRGRGLGQARQQRVRGQRGRHRQQDRASHGSGQEPPDVRSAGGGGGTQGADQGAG